MTDTTDGATGAWLFAAGALALGLLPLPLALAVAPPGGLAQAAPGLHLPPWLFGAIWMVIDPAFGVATWRVWSRRARPGGPEALALAGVAFFVLLAFLPVTAAAHDQRVTAMMDVVGLVCGYAAAWAYRRVDAGTTRWMLPVLLWLPATAALKLVTLP